MDIRPSILHDGAEARSFLMLTLSSLSTSPAHVSCPMPCEQRRHEGTHPAYGAASLVLSVLLLSDVCPWRNDALQHVPSVGRALLQVTLALKHTTGLKVE